MTAAQMRAVDNATIHDNRCLDRPDGARALACVDWLLAHAEQRATTYFVDWVITAATVWRSRDYYARVVKPYAYLIDHSTGDALMSAMSSDAAINWQRLQTLANQQNASTEHIIVSLSAFDTALPSYPDLRIPPSAIV